MSDVAVERIGGFEVPFLVEALMSEEPRLVVSWLVADGGMPQSEAEVAVQDLLASIKAGLAEVAEERPDLADRATSLVESVRHKLLVKGEPANEVADWLVARHGADEGAATQLVVSVLDEAAKGDAGHTAEGGCADPDSDGKIFTESEGGQAPRPEAEEPEMTETTAPAAAPKNALRPCACGKFEVVTREFETDGQPDFDAYGTGCNRTTKNEFAPGHDAKLKGLLIRAGVAGYQVLIHDGGVQTWTDAQGAANRFAFAYMVAEGIAKGKEKAEARKAAADAKHAAKAEREAAKAAKKAKADEPAPRDLGRAKIGRWEYDGEFVDGGFRYTTKNDEVKFVTTGFTRI